MNFKAAASIPDNDLTDIGSTAQGAQSTQTAQPGQEDVFSSGSSTDIGSDPKHDPSKEEKADAAKPAGKKTMREALGDKGGKTATQLMDLLIPVVVSLVIGLLGRKIDTEKLKLTKEEKELFAPAWDQVLETFFVDENNPWFMLALVGGVIYSAKIIEVLPDIKKKEPAAKPESTNGVKDSAPVVPVKKTFDEMYAIAYDELVTEEAKKRKKGDDEAKAYLDKTGSFERLKEKVQLRYEQQ